MTTEPTVGATPDSPPRSSERGLAPVLRWLEQRSPDVHFDPRGLVVWIAVAVVAATYAVIAWTTAGPLLAADEVGMVGAAEVIARGTTDWSLAGAGYMPGLAALLAPAWWFTDNAFAVYHVGLAIGVALSVLTIWPLAAVIRAAGGVSQRGSVVVASVVMLLPARTLTANYVVSEALLAFLTAVAVACAFSFARRPTARTSAILGVAAGLVFLAHGRGIAIVLAAGVWVLVYAGRRWRLGLAFVAASGAVSLAAWLLFTWIAGELYINDDRLSAAVNGITTFDAGDALAASVGMAWYAVAAWPAVALLGLALLVKRSTADRGAELFVIIALLAATALSLVQLDLPTEQALPRLDIWIYGRYLDHLLTVVAALGLALLMRVRHRAMVLVVGGGSGLVGLAFVVFTVPKIPLGGYWTDLHVAGVSHLLSEANYLDAAPEPWVLSTLAVVAIGTLLVVLGRLRFVLPVLAAFGLCLSLATDATRVDPRDEGGRLVKEVSEPLEYVTEGEPVAFRRDAELRINLFAFAAHPRPIVPVTVEAASAQYPAIYSFFADGEPAEYGARRLATPPYYLTSLWIFPGPLADQLDAQGMLVAPAE